MIKKFIYIFITVVSSLMMFSCNNSIDIFYKFIILDYYNI
jgi:hypothetical protein